MTLLTSHTNGSVIDYGKRAPRAHAAPRIIHVSHSPFALASAHGRARAELTELMPGFYIGSEMEKGKGGGGDKNRTWTFTPYRNTGTWGP
jgi:hypothetical protein